MARYACTLLLILGLVAVSAAPALGQGVQTGTLRGTVQLPDGNPVPGALVTAKSPDLLGERTTATSESGEYILRGLPPGPYTVTFTLEGLEAVDESATVNLGQVTPLDVTMKPSTIEEEVEVKGEMSPVLASSEVSTTYDAEQANQIPLTQRTPTQIARLSPGLTSNAPNSNGADGQITISGGFAYDNVFLVDGVDANDNLFGTTSPDYIEEAISDVQVLTSGISAEYGRFSGGVVNVITKTGGNEFTGSIRRDMTNDKWRSRTPLEKDRGTELQDKVNHFDSGTLGGYVLKDKLWFFGAGRDESTNQTTTFAGTGLPRSAQNDEQRWELKLTGNVLDRHQLQAAYTDRDSTNTQPAFSFSATPDTIRTRMDPSKLEVARYLGSLTDNLFAEVQWSKKTFTFQNSNLDNGLEESSPFLSNTTSPFVHYHAPYFDGTDPEDRDNQQITGSLSWFADTEKLGSHDVKFGVEDFTSKRTGGNSQSPTDFVFQTDPLQNPDGSYVVDDNDRLIPTFVPGQSLILNWLPTRGAKVEINTRSAFVNDRWRLNKHWSFNLGARYEQVNGEATGGITTVDTSAIVPRLGASFDPRGDGEFRFDATYAQYAGKYSEAQFAENTTVGNPRLLAGFYVGPEGQGNDFAPGFDPNNYVTFFANDGTANVRVANDIHSPVVDEITLSGGMQLSHGGYLKLIYTDRSYSDFVEDFLCSSAAGVPCPGPGDTGTTFVSVEGVDAGEFNNTVIDNSNEPERKYRALQLLGRYQFTPKWTVNGNWTYQLKNNGNFEGEGTNTPGISSTFGDFPGVFVASRHFPTGKLDDYQAHKVRLWSTYLLGMGRFGQLATTVLANYNSGTTFSFTDSIALPFSAEQDRILGFYNSSPGSTQSVFFGKRGAGTFPSSLTFDLGLFYELPVWKRLGTFVKMDVFNILNDDQQIEYTANITANTDGPVDQFGLPTQFTRAGNFKDPIDNDSFVPPREIQLAVGFRL